MYGDRNAGFLVGVGVNTFKLTVFSYPENQTNLPLVDVLLQILVGKDDATRSGRGALINREQNLVPRNLKLRHVTDLGQNVALEGGRGVVLLGFQGCC